MASIIKQYNGKVIKNAGDCLIYYFPKTVGIINSSSNSRNSYSINDNSNENIKDNANSNDQIIKTSNKKPLSITSASIQVASDALVLGLDFRITGEVEWLTGSPRSSATPAPTRSSAFRDQRGARPAVRLCASSSRRW